MSSDVVLYRRSFVEDFSLVSVTLKLYLIVICRFVCTYMMHRSCRLRGLLFGNLKGRKLKKKKHNLETAFGSERLMLHTAGVQVIIISRFQVKNQIEIINQFQRFKLFQN